MKHRKYFGLVSKSQLKVGKSILSGGAAFFEVREGNESKVVSLDVAQIQNLIVFLQDSIAGSKVEKPLWEDVG